MAKVAQNMERYRVSVPPNDKTVLEWIKAQSNLSFSFRELVKDFVGTYGIVDVTCMNVTPGSKLVSELSGYTPHPGRPVGLDSRTSVFDAGVTSTKIQSQPEVLDKSDSNPFVSESVHVKVEDDIEDEDDIKNKVQDKVKNKVQDKVQNKVQDNAQVHTGSQDKILSKTEVQILNTETNTTDTGFVQVVKPEQEFQTTPVSDTVTVPAASPATDSDGFVDPDSFFSH